MKNIILLLLISCFAVSCSDKSEDLKSPCVGTENSPCGPRKPVNNWLT